MSWSRLAVSLAAGTLLAAPAWAWNQYKTGQGKPMRWPAAALAAPITYTVDESGLGADGLQLGEVRAAIAAGLAAWQGVGCPPCHAAPLANGFADAGVAPAAPVGLGCAGTDAFGCSERVPDGNQLVFVHQQADWPYGWGVIAMTVVSARPQTGFIADADIAFNDAHFAFCATACTADRVQLEAVVRHEAGHFVGLDHSQDPAAVMYGQPPKVIAKPTAMSGDDEAGLCAAYGQEIAGAACAKAVAAKAGQPAGAGGCGAGRGAGWLGVLGVALVVIRRKSETAFGAIKAGSRSVETPESP